MLKITEDVSENLNCFRRLLQYCRMYIVQETKKLNFSDLEEVREKLIYWLLKDRPKHSVY